MIRRFGPRFGLDQERMGRARAFFRDHGSRGAFLGRFLAFLRIIVPMLAGVTHMPFPRFSAYNAVGSTAAAAVYGCLGYSSAAICRRWNDT